MAMYHHVTPQSYLRSFADDTNRVCVVEGNEVWRHPRSVRTVGGEDDFYAEAQPAGTTDHHVERNVLRNIDRIGAELLARFRDGELPATDEERSTFGSYLVLQITRSFPLRDAFEWMREHETGERERHLAEYTLSMLEPFWAKRGFLALWLSDKVSRIWRSACTSATPRTWPSRANA